MAERRRVDLQRVMTRISILVARNCFAPISEMWRERPGCGRPRPASTWTALSPRRLIDAPAALSIMFATSMTQDPAQQSDQASILNEIMSRWQPVLPWQLVRRSS